MERYHWPESNRSRYTLSASPSVMSSSSNKSPSVRSNLSLSGSPEPMDAWTNYTQRGQRPSSIEARVWKSAAGMDAGDEHAEVMHPISLETQVGGRSWTFPDTPEGGHYDGHPGSAHFQSMIHSHTADLRPSPLSRSLDFPGLSLPAGPHSTSSQLPHSTRSFSSNRLLPSSAGSRRICIPPYPSLAAQVNNHANSTFYSLPPLRPPTLILPPAANCQPDDDVSMDDLALSLGGKRLSPRDPHHPMNLVSSLASNTCHSQMPRSMSSWSAPSPAPPSPLWPLSWGLDLPDQSNRQSELAS